MKTQQTYEEAVFERTREESSTPSLEHLVCDDGLPRAAFIVSSLNKCADPYQLSNCSHVRKVVSSCTTLRCIFRHTRFLCVLYSIERLCSRHVFPRVFVQQWFIIRWTVFILSPVLWFEFRLTQVQCKHSIGIQEDPVIIPGTIASNYWFGSLSLKTLKRLLTSMLMVYERFIAY